MRRFLICCLFLVPLVGRVIAQTPEIEQQLVALIKEVQIQQKQIGENQAKIDAKLAEVAEAVRLARIYAKREK